MHATRQRLHPQLLHSLPFTLSPDLPALLLRQSKHLPVSPRPRNLLTQRVHGLRQRHRQHHRHGVRAAEEVHVERLH